MRTGQRIEARDTETAEAVFQVTDSESFPFDGFESAMPVSKRRSKLAYQGDLRGEGILEEICVHFTDDHMTMTGLQQISGYLGKHSGTFLLNHTAHLRQGILTGKHVVVPGSATGGLKGLRGKLSYQTRETEKILITFQYYFA